MEMPTLYLTPASISYLSQFILSLVITGYLLFLSLRPGLHAKKSPHTVLLASFFACITLLILLLFLETSFLPGDRLFPLFWETVAVALGLVFLNYFAYSFPNFSPRQKWERRTVTGLIILYALFEAGYALYRLDLLLTVGEVHWRPSWADYALVACFLWAPLTLARQSVRASAATAITSAGRVGGGFRYAKNATQPSPPYRDQAQQTPMSGSPDPAVSGSPDPDTLPTEGLQHSESGQARPAVKPSTGTGVPRRAAAMLPVRTWLRYLWKPQGKEARSARALALVYLLPLAMSVILLLNTLWVLPASTNSALFSLGVLFSLFVFALVYLNSLAETTTFMVRVAGVAMMSILAVLSVTGWWLGPLFIAQYTPDSPPISKPCVSYPTGTKVTMWSRSPSTSIPPARPGSLTSCTDFTPACPCPSIFHSTIGHTSRFTYPSSAG